ncbi:dTDP-4-dehydrorhamnose reductase [Herbaspirillum sp. RTI4]|uniref:dTDP-4-dehydrorhamnose reductase n=1 Tax=Herbaspirillum sp. RTI4 TaxID=3048640 RepID=UPI002AB456C0|nr:dTDP-4-dehydrorhamnose reductase [Herbaspirillum sp. RTI4]MDY7577604.1 dTDP-4-dehydrorhamnose reductase [Herbaspirillum sp. RTI4]MEA9983275.1 dTDP-4-dehydrorhamnose reductase [Herbaspirillum sp. RTI4]
MKILVTGGSGQVGSELLHALTGLGALYAPNRSQLDLTDLKKLREVIRDMKPDLIVNPAAYTAVDKAETEPELAALLNAHAPAVMAEEAQKLGAAMIHYSTDYVFDGMSNHPYAETDRANPQSVYGRTKLEGELAVSSVCEAHWIFRTSWVYGVHGGNFLKTILRLAAERETLRIVADQYGAPTWARLIAQKTADALSVAIKTGGIAACPGTYHLCAGGIATWHEYACYIVDRAQELGVPLALTSASIEPISTEAYPLPASRPRSSRLATDKFQQTFQLKFPCWQGDVNACLSEFLQKHD